MTAPNPPAPETLIDDLVAIAEIPAPTFSEARRLDWLAARLDHAQGERSRDATGNLLWRWGEGTPRVVVAAHVDNVFEEGIDLTVKREDGLLVGPGVGDNAAAIAVTVNAVERLLDASACAPGAVAFTIGEEGLGNLLGARAVTAALRPAMFVAVEGHLLDQVIVDAVGSVRARVVVHGPGGHPWFDRGRPSALHELLALGCNLLDESPKEGRVNIGLMQAGRSVNSIADEAHLVVEFRSLDAIELATFEAYLAELTVPAPLSVTAELLGHRPTGRLDRDHELLRTVLSVREEIGLSTRLDAGSTDANAAFGEGIPALTVGVARGGEMHTMGEWIDEASLELGYRQLHDILARLLADSPP